MAGQPCSVGAFPCTLTWRSSAGKRLVELCLIWHCPNCFQYAFLPLTVLASTGEPALRCWRACRLCAPAVQLHVAALVLHLIQAAFPHSGYHRLKEGAVPTIFESFSKLRRTTKTKGHSYPPGSPDVSRLRRCRKRYVLWMGGYPTPTSSLRVRALGYLPAAMLNRVLSLWGGFKGAGELWSGKLLA